MHGTYDIAGKLLEVCSCDVICPCWVGRDPDGGSCTGILVYAIERGTIDGIDVSGVAVADLSYLTGNILAGSMMVSRYLSHGVSTAQETVVLEAFLGNQGGALADVASLIGKVVYRGRAEIVFSWDQKTGVVRVGDTAEATLTQLTDREGAPTTLQNTVMTTVPGSPVYVGVAPFMRMDVPGEPTPITLTERNAILAEFRFRN